jgi:prepilin-type N-terminal cleavage/methylation domain-containing protein
MYALSKKPRLRSGFTLIEIAIVLGVIGLVISAIWVAAQQVSNSRKVQKADTQVMQILNGYRGLYTGHGVDDTSATSFDVTCTGVQNGYFPSDMISVPCVNVSASPSMPTYPQTPWGGGTYVMVRAYQSPITNFPTSNTISISYYFIPTSACVALASSLINNPDVIVSMIGPAFTAPNPNVYPPYGAATIPTIPTITGWCSTSNSNEVTIGFKAQ